MGKTNTVVAIRPGPAAPVVLTQGAEKRGLTIPELAHYLGTTNWAAEEALRQGKIQRGFWDSRKTRMGTSMSGTSEDMDLLGNQLTVGSWHKMKYAI